MSSKIRYPKFLDAILQEVPTSTAATTFQELLEIGDINPEWKPSLITRVYVPGSEDFPGEVRRRALTEVLADAYDEYQELRGRRNRAWRG